MAQTSTSPGQSTPSPRSSVPSLQLPPPTTSPQPVAASETSTKPPTEPPTNPSSTSTASTFIPPWRRPTLANTTPGSARRPSVQFVPNARETGGSSSRSSSARASSTRQSYPTPATSTSTLTNSAKPNRSSIGARRLSSPPPPAQFRPSVGFDTFNNPSASDFSLTLNRKHRDYEYTKRSRTFLCGTDTNEYSDTALEWLIDELVDDGDEVVCVRVVEKDSKEAAKWSGGRGEKGYREEAERFLEGIERKNTEGRAISLVLEFSVGKVNETIQRMITIYEPVILVVGTRGRSLTGYQGLINSGSVSKHCLQYSPVPVIVVRPSSKREKKKLQRLQDPTRTGYRDILDKSDDAPRGRGTHLLDANHRTSLKGTELGALGEMHGDQEAEARRVAEAIGWPAARELPRPASRDGRAGSLSRVRSDGSGRSADADTLSPSGRLLKSPELRHVDSPTVSDDEGEEGEGYDEELGRLTESVIRPEDEAAMLAYERAQKVFEEEKEEAEARAKRQARSGSRGRSESRGRRRTSQEEGRGAEVLDIFEKLNRGIK